MNTSIFNHIKEARNSVHQVQEQIWMLPKWFKVALLFHVIAPCLFVLIRHFEIHFNYVYFESVLNSIISAKTDQQTHNPLSTDTLETLISVLTISKYLDYAWFALWLMSSVIGSLFLIVLIPKTQPSNSGGEKRRIENELSSPLPIHPIETP